MNVATLAETLGLKAISAADTDREVANVYIGDLLSWVMGRAGADSAWLTIMSNVNVAAVAALADVACVILAEDVEPDADLLAAAKLRGINLYSSPESLYTLAWRIHDCLQL